MTHLLRPLTRHLGSPEFTKALKTLDSSMKKNQALIRKLKTLSEVSAPGVLADLKKLNHSKYISEAVSAILEAPLKLKDVRSTPVLEVLSWLHRCYPDFETVMFARLMDELTGNPALTTAKKRLFMRLFFGCVQAGIFSASNVRYITCDKLFRSLTVEKLSPGSDNSIQSLQLVNSFLKSGGPGLYPRICSYKNEMQLRDLAGKGDAGAKACVDEIDKLNGMKLQLWALSESDEQKMRMKIQAYVEGALKALESWWKKVQQTKRSNDAAIQSRGDISDKRHQDYKEMCDALDAFQKSVGTLAATLRVSLPEYVIEDEVESEDKGDVHVVEPTRIFEDAEERAMYMALPQLAEVVPSTLLGAMAEVRGHGSLAESAAEPDEAEHLSVEQIIDEVGEADGSFCADDNGDDDTNGPNDKCEGSDAFSASSSLSELISRLPECVTMEECDAFSVQYCYVGGKKASSQKALALALSRPPHGAIQLLPFYSRIVASLAPFFPLVKEEILVKLQRQFYGLKNVVDISTDTLEPRLRNACYIAELVKFGVYPPGKAFIQLRSLFEDFSRQNIDTACCLVEHCGNYLYKRPDTSERMVNMMNTMLKLKDAKNMETRYEELIVQARATMYGVETRVQRKLRSPVHEFIRYQIYTVLSPDVIAQVAENLRRIDWQSESGYVRKKVLGAVRKGKESQLIPLASLVLELQRFDRQFGADVVDEVVEELYCGMDHPEVSHYHRRLSMARFLGAMAHVRMPGVDNEMLIGMMRTFMSYSTTAPLPNASSELKNHANGAELYGEILEPVFRVRLVVGLCVEAKSLYVTKSRRMREGQPLFTEQMKVRRQQKAVKTRVLPFLEEFVMRNELLPYEKDGTNVSTLASNSVDALIQGMYQACKFGKRNRFETYEEAVQNLAAAMGRLHHSSEHEALTGQAEDVDEDAVDLYDIEDDDDTEDVEDVNDIDDGDDVDDFEDANSEALVDISNSINQGSHDDPGTVDRTDGPSQEELMFDRELAVAMGVHGGNVSSSGTSISTGRPKALAARPARVDNDDDDGQVSRPNKLAFKVMTKRGGRDDKSKRTVHIPVSSSLVEQVAKKKKAEAEEKAALKRMVLASSNL